MIPEALKTKLKENWCEDDTALYKKAIVRLYDPTSTWECYLIAMDKEEQDVLCIIHPHKHAPYEFTGWTIGELSYLYNENGEGIQIDDEFVPCQASVIMKKMEKEYNVT